LPCPLRPPRTPAFPYPTPFRSRLLFAEHLFVQGLDARVGFGRERLLPGDLAGLVPDLHPVPRAFLGLFVTHAVSSEPDVFAGGRSAEHTSELQSRERVVCRLLP